MLLDLPESAYQNIGATKGEYLSRVLDFCHDVLKLPHSWEAIATLGHERQPGCRAIAFVLADESRRSGVAWTASPVRVRASAQGVLLAIYHRVVVGTVTELRLLPPGAIPGTIGYTVVGRATIDDGPLGHAAWRGIVAGVLPAVSGTFDKDTDELLEVGLCFEGACPSATVLDINDGSAPGDPDGIPSRSA
jgi:hypothetical protein